MKAPHVILSELATALTISNGPVTIGEEDKDALIQALRAAASDMEHPVMLQPVKVGATVTVEGSAWEYSRYRATLRKHGKTFAIVTPDGQNALSQKDAEELVQRLTNSEAIPSNVRIAYNSQLASDEWPWTVTFGMQSFRGESPEHCVLQAAEKLTELEVIKTTLRLLVQ